MGVSQSEFGFPVAHHGNQYLECRPELAEEGVVAPISFERMDAGHQREMSRLAFKLVPELKHINLSISTSDQMIIHKLVKRQVY